MHGKDRVCLKFLCVTQNSDYEVMRQFYLSGSNSALLLLVLLGLIFYFSTYLLNVQSMAPYEHLNILKLSKEGIDVRRKGKTSKK